MTISKIMKEVKKRMAVHEIIAAESLLAFLAEFESLDYDSAPAWKNAVQNAVSTAKRASEHLRAARELAGLTLPTTSEEIEKMLLGSGWEKVNHKNTVEFYTHVHGKVFNTKLFHENHQFYDSSRNAALLEFEAWKAFKKMLEDSKND